MVEAEQTWSAAQIGFAQAMMRYETRPIYARISRVVAYAVVGLQWVLLVAAWRSALGVVMHGILVCAAFVLADFVNGMVHLYMDHQRGYRSFVGPFVAAFHLHHDRPNYTEKPIFRVYLDESGSKIWLAVALVLFGIVAVFFWGCALGAVFCCVFCVLVFMGGGVAFFVPQPQRRLGVVVAKILAVAAASAPHAAPPF